MQYVYFSVIPKAIILLTTLVPACDIQVVFRFFLWPEENQMKDDGPNLEDKNFAEFRRKIRHAEVLSAATEKLLRSLHFSGRLSVVVQNGSILKSGYEEGYFTRRQEDRMLP